MKQNPFSLKPSDVDFLMRTAVFALMVLALLHAFQPYLSDSEAANPRQIATTARGMKSITATDIAKQIAESRKPTMLVVYASWCSYCKQLMPSIHEIWKENKLGAFQLLFISVDEQNYQLASYIMGNDFTTMIGTPPLVYSKDDALKIADVLSPLGATYKGGIPYIGFFAPGGKIIGELQGLVDKDEIEDAAQRASR